MHLLALLFFPFVYCGLVPCYGTAVFVWEVSTQLIIIVIFLAFTGEFDVLKETWPKLVSLTVMCILTSMTARELFKRQVVIFVCNEIIGRSAVQNERRIIAAEPLLLYT